MTAEQQLERSVLEGKERDELSAIAQAMSLKTTSRTKKADIIDQILDATGVTSGPAAGGQSNGDADHHAPMMMIALLLDALGGMGVRSADRQRTDQSDNQERMTQCHGGDLR